jgi:hypothetical protein
MKKKHEKKKLKPQVQNTLVLVYESTKKGLKKDPQKTAKN